MARLRLVGLQKPRGSPAALPLAHAGHRVPTPRAARPPARVRALLAPAARPAQAAPTGIVMDGEAARTAERGCCAGRARVAGRDSPRA